MPLDELVRENPLGALFVASAAAVWLVVLVRLAGVLPGTTRGLIRLAAVAVVLSAFAVGFGARTVGERYL